MAKSHYLLLKLLKQQREEPSTTKQEIVKSACLLKGKKLNKQSACIQYWIFKIEKNMNPLVPFLHQCLKWSLQMYLLSTGVDTTDVSIVVDW
jgi:hypothetical protein